MSKLSAHLDDFRSNDYMEFSYHGDDIEQQIKNLSRDYDEIIYLPGLSMSIGGYAFADTAHQFGWMVFETSEGEYEILRHHLSQVTHHGSYIAPMGEFEYLRDEREMLAEHTGEMGVVAISQDFDIVRVTDSDGRVVSYWGGSALDGSYRQVTMSEAYELVLSNPKTTTVIGGAGIVWAMVSAMVSAIRDYSETDPGSNDHVEFRALGNVDFSRVVHSLIEE